MPKLIETPYGRKTPELLCKAMDALVVQPELVKALALFIENMDPLYPEDHICMKTGRAALARANGGLL